MAAREAPPTSRALVDARRQSPGRRCGILPLSISLFAVFGSAARSLMRVVDALNHIEMHLNLRLCHLSKTLQIDIVAALGVAAHQNQRFVMRIFLLGDKASIEVFGLSALQVIDHSLVARIK